MNHQKNATRIFILSLMAAAAIAFGIQQTTGKTASGTESHSYVDASQTVRTLETPRMMELYAPYCPSCREMDPLMDKLQKSCDKNSVQVVKVDISQTENESLVEEYGVSAVPTFIFIDENGIETMRLVGKQEASTLTGHLRSITGQKCPSLS